MFSLKDKFKCVKKAEGNSIILSRADIGELSLTFKTKPLPVPHTYAMQLTNGARHLPQ